MHSAFKVFNDGSFLNRMVFLGSFIKSNRRNCIRYDQMSQLVGQKILWNTGIRHDPITATAFNRIASLKPELQSRTSSRLLHGSNNVPSTSVFQSSTPPAVRSDAVSDTASAKEGAKAVTRLSECLSPILFKGNKENFVYSPLSLALVLAMLEHGAGEMTKSALRNLLIYQGYCPELSLVESLAALTKIFCHSGLVKMGNALYISSAAENMSKTYFEYIEGVLQELSDSSGSQYKVDIVKHEYMVTEKFKENINQTISGWTEKKINEILPYPLTNLEKVLVINTVLFKARWAQQLDTIPDFKFCDRSGNTCKVPAVTNNHSHYASVNHLGKSWEVAWCALEKEGYGVLLAMPPERMHAEAFSDSSVFFEAMKAVTKSREIVTAEFPKLKLESELDFVSIIARSEQFKHAVGRYSDFSGIASNLKVSTIKHTTVFELNEFGVEAAAVTAAVLYDGIRDRVSLSFNRPFKIFVGHMPTATTLFEGNVTGSPELP